MFFTRDSSFWQAALPKLCACQVTSVVSNSVTLWIVAHQAPLSMGFSRHESWSELPCLPPGDLPDPGIEPESPVSPALQVDSFPLSHLGSPVAFVGKCKRTTDMFQKISDT